MENKTIPYSIRITKKAKQALDDLHKHYEDSDTPLSKNKLVSVALIKYSETILKSNNKT
jgi:hypothetical protein